MGKRIRRVSKVNEQLIGCYFNWGFYFYSSESCTSSSESPPPTKKLRSTSTTSSKAAISGTDQDETPPPITVKYKGYTRTVPFKDFSPRAGHVPLYGLPSDKRGRTAKAVLLDWKRRYLENSKLMHPLKLNQINVYFF